MTGARGANGIPPANDGPEEEDGLNGPQDAPPVAEHSLPILGLADHPRATGRLRRRRDVTLRGAGFKPATFGL